MRTESTIVQRRGATGQRHALNHFAVGKTTQLTKHHGVAHPPVPQAPGTASTHATHEATHEETHRMSVMECLQLLSLFESITANPHPHCTEAKSGKRPSRPVSLFHTTHGILTSATVSQNTQVARHHLLDAQQTYSFHFWVSADPWSPAKKKNISRNITSRGPTLTLKKKHFHK